MTTTSELQCFDCVHLRDEKGYTRITCDAYPKGIPDDILYMKHIHTKPYKGDNGILFKKKTE